jgi:glucose/arabinose dehydrogenase
LTDAVSRATLDGQVTTVFKGVIDNQSEHQINDIKVGPDGRMFVTVGPAGNAAVVDDSIGPWVMKSPELRTTPCKASSSPGATSRWITS